MKCETVCIEWPLVCEEKEDEEAEEEEEEEEMQFCWVYGQISDQQGIKLIWKD